MTELHAAAPIPFARTVVTSEAIDAVSRVLGSGWLTTGPEVRRVRGGVRGVVGAREAVAVSSCTAALELAFRALRAAGRARRCWSRRSRSAAPSTRSCTPGWCPVLADVDPADRHDAEPAHRAGRRRPRGGGVRGDGGAALRRATRRRSIALAEAAGLPLSRVVEDAAHARRHADRRRTGRQPCLRGHLLQLLRHQEPARSARAAWSPPTTRSSPTASAGPGCTG